MFLDAGGHSENRIENNNSSIALNTNSDVLISNTTVDADLESEVVGSPRCVVCFGESSGVAVPGSCMCASAHIREVSDSRQTHAGQTSQSATVAIVSNPESPSMCVETHV